MSLAIVGGLLVSMDDNVGIIENSYIYIEDGLIVEVGKSSEECSRKADYVIDAKGKVVIPGLIDSHRHLYGIITRGMPVKVKLKSFIEFLEEFWWPNVEDKLQIDMIRAAAAASGLEAVKNGTTCVVDILEAPYSINGSLDAEADELRKIGLRGKLSIEASERVSTENGYQAHEENLKFVRKMREDPLIRGMFCIHTTFTCSESFLKEVRETATREHEMIHLHLEEGKYETLYSIVNRRMLPVEFYEKIGFLGPDVLAAQCVNLTAKEIEILAKYDVKTSHEPISNCEVGGGVAPVPEMINSGLTVGLGTDGYITDMFEVMRFAFHIHKGYRRDPSIMPAETILKMATIWNAKAIGMEKQIGSIREGKKADITVLNLKTPTKISKDNVINLIVLWGRGDNVTHVVVDGKVIVENGNVKTVDEEKIINRLRAAAEKLWENSLA